MSIAKWLEYQPVSVSIAGSLGKKLYSSLVYSPVNDCFASSGHDAAELKPEDPLEF